MPNIVFIGSECSGKTSLARALANYYNIDFLEEYSRIYAEKINSELIYEDVIPIAKGQIASEQKFINRSKEDLLLFDTCLFSTYIYSKIYYKKVPKELNNWLDLSLYDYFFLIFPDPEWVEDDIRNMPMPRMEMHEIFKSELEYFNQPFTQLRGNEEQRMQSAIEEINRLGYNKF